MKEIQNELISPSIQRELEKLTPDDFNLIEEIASISKANVIGTASEIERKYFILKIKKLNEIYQLQAAYTPQKLIQPLQVTYVQTLESLIEHSVKDRFPELKQTGIGFEIDQNFNIIQINHSTSYATSKKVVRLFKEKTK